MIQTLAIANYRSLRSLVLVGFTGSPHLLCCILNEFTALTDLAVQSVSFPDCLVAEVYPPAVEDRLFGGLTAAPSTMVSCPSLESFVYLCLTVDDLGFWAHYSTWSAPALPPPHPLTTTRGVACATSASSGLDTGTPSADQHIRGRYTQYKVGGCRS